MSDIHDFPIYEIPFSNGQLYFCSRESTRLLTLKKTQDVDLFSTRNSSSLEWIPEETLFGTPQHIVSRLFISRKINTTFNFTSIISLGVLPILSEDQNYIATKTKEGSVDESLTEENGTKIQENEEHFKDLERGEFMNISHYYLPNFLDTLQEDLTTVLFPSLLPFIHQSCNHKSQKEGDNSSSRILLHCNMGQSRCIAVALAYLICYEGIPYQIPLETLSLNLSKVDHSIAVNPGFLRQLHWIQELVLVPYILKDEINLFKENKSFQNQDKVIYRDQWRRQQAKNELLMYMIGKLIDENKYQSLVEFQKKRKNELLLNEDDVKSKDNKNKERDELLLAIPDSDLYLPIPVLILLRALKERWLNVARKCYLGKLTQLSMAIPNYKPFIVNKSTNTTQATASNLSIWEIFSSLYTISMEDWDTHEQHGNSTTQNYDSSNLVYRRLLLRCKECRGKLGYWDESILRHTPDSLSFSDDQQFCRKTKGNEENSFYDCIEQMMGPLLHLTPININSRSREDKRIIEKEKSGYSPLCKCNLIYLAAQPWAMKQIVIQSSTKNPVPQTLQNNQINYSLDEDEKDFENGKAIPTIFKEEQVINLDSKNYSCSIQIKNEGSIYCPYMKCAAKRQGTRLGFFQFRNNSDLSEYSFRKVGDKNEVPNVNCYRTMCQCSNLGLKYGGIYLSASTVELDEECIKV